MLLEMLFEHGVSFNETQLKKAGKPTVYITPAEHHYLVQMHRHGLSELAAVLYYAVAARENVPPRERRLTHPAMVSYRHVLKAIEDSLRELPGRPSYAFEGGARLY